MRQNPIDRLAAKMPYDKKEILNQLEDFQVTTKGSVVITKYKDKTYKSDRSSNYEVVDFKKVVSALLENIGGIMQPNFYNLTIKKGYQELKLRGDDHIIGGETFHEMIWLTNSNDGTKKLSIRYGLMRQICSNGVVRTVKGDGFSVKHLKSNEVNEQLKTFIKSLPALDVTQEIKTIKKIQKKDVTVREVADYLVNRVGEKGNDAIWKKLVRKLNSSKTDRLGGADDARINVINVPFHKMTDEQLDVKLPAWNVFNCYTELWRSLDAGEIARETEKILAVLS